MGMTKSQYGTHYMVMRLPEKKPAPTACSSWTSPELGLPRYLDGPKTVVLGAECLGERRNMSTSQSSMTYKKTMSEQKQPDRILTWKESVLAAESASEDICFSPRPLCY